MKILFVVPPVKAGDAPAERSSGCTHIVYATPNIYELTVAAWAEQLGYEVEFADCINDNISGKDLINRIKNVGYNACLIWTVNLSLQSDLFFCKGLGAECPSLPIILLGPGATYYYKQVLEEGLPNIIVVRGEPELTVGELLECIKNGTSWNNVEGLSYYDGKEVRSSGMRPLMRDLDALPIPARHLVAHITYRNAKLKKTPYTTMVTSRNCPFQCIYCVPSSLTFAREIEYRRFNGKKPPISFRSIEKIEEEVKLLHEEGYRAIGFMDDNFIWNEKRTLAICNILHKYNMVWGCQARVDAITDTIAKALAESNCQYVDLGVESFNDEILNYINKGITSEQITTAIKTLQNHGVPVKMNILIGTCPLETEDTIKETIHKAKQLKVSQVMINIVAPFPGTKFYDLAKENGWIEGGDYVPTDVQRNSILNYPHLTARQMERILFWSNFKYFLSPSFVWRHVKQFRSLSEFTHALKTLKVKLFG